MDCLFDKLNQTHMYALAVVFMKPVDEEKAEGDNPEGMTSTSWQ